jgi:hypothetical protein
MAQKQNIKILIPTSRATRRMRPPTGPLHGVAHSMGRNVLTTNSCQIVTLYHCQWHIQTGGRACPKKLNQRANRTVINQDRCRQREENREYHYGKNG